MDGKTLEERVVAFQLLELPGQPRAMHMGTGYLVNDLWQEVLRLRKEKEKSGQASREAEPDVYAGYVIREDGRDYIGPDSERYRVALREHAARFTMTEALQYLKNGYFLKVGRTYKIEPA